jgi:hypothetical protein
LLFCITSLAIAQDSASVLARILNDKGTITASELAQVEAAGVSERVNVLARLLESKGVLTRDEVAGLVSPPHANGEPTSTPAMAVARTTQGSVAGARQPGPTTEAAAVTAQSRFPLTLYGTILMNSFYNTAAANVTDVPLFWAKQGSDALGNDKVFGMTARQSRFGVRYQSTTEVIGARLSGQLELDLLGGKAPFANGVDFDLIRLRLAFGRLDWSHFAFEAGQDWGVFAPLSPTSLASYAIAEFSAAGNPWIRLPQVRAEYRTGSKGSLGFLAQVAALDPNMGDYNFSSFVGTRPPGVGERGRAPAIESRVALTGRHDDRDFTVAVSEHWAHGKNSGVVGPATVQLPIDSWGVAIDYSLPFTKLFNLSGEMYTGRALGIYSVTAGESILAPGSPGDRGVRSRGGWTQAQLNFNPKWQLNLAYGLDDPTVRDLPIGNRTRNQSYMGNVQYKYSPHFTVAWEYRRILTDFRNQRFANERGDHANLAFAYLF